MDKNVHTIRLESWAKLIAEANTSGMTRTAWCMEHGISIRRFHYWQKKVRDYLLEHPNGFTDDLSQPVPLASTPPDTQSFYEIELPLSTHTVHAEQTIQVEGGSLTAPSLILEFDHFQLQIRDGFRENTLSSVIRAIKNA